MLTWAFSCRLIVLMAFATQKGVILVSIFSECTFFNHNFICIITGLPTLMVDRSGKMKIVRTEAMFRVATSPVSVCLHSRHEKENRSCEEKEMSIEVTLWWLATWLANTTAGKWWVGSEMLKRSTLTAAYLLINVQSAHFLIGEGQNSWTNWGQLSCCDFNSCVLPVWVNRQHCDIFETAQLVKWQFYHHCNVRWRQGNSFLDKGGRVKKRWWPKDKQACLPERLSPTETGIVARLF